VARPTVVTNASPLIYLALLDRFHLLNDLFGEVGVPDAVYREVVLEGARHPGAYETTAALKTGHFRRMEVRHRIAVDVLLEQLHPGEAEAIVLARESNVGRVLLDDRIARNKAKLMGLSVTGTIGLLRLGKQRGMRIDLQASLDLLIQHNFRISADLYERLVKDNA